MTKLLDKLFRPDKKRAPGVKPFAEKQRQEEAFDERDLGLRTVQLDKIVGSVGRYNDFDKHFRLKPNRPSERLEGIRKALEQGKQLPPVELFQIKNEYYVLDGNHRVAAANAMGREFIDAHIIEFLPSKNTLSNILYREKFEFLKTTELPDTIELTEIGQYAYLMKQIQEYQRNLESDAAGKAPVSRAALDWYRSVYKPLATIIQNSRLPSSFPKRTVADLYAYITFHQWERGRNRSYGIGIDQLIPQDMEGFRKKMAERNGFDLPEMKHRISAFILINVKVGSEYRVMDKLFRMPEIEEVHFVHGESDLLAKLVLERDLLMSDAEIIGKVVHEKVRRIPDVTKTKTMIPISSKQKSCRIPEA